MEACGRAACGRRVGRSSTQMRLAWRLSGLSSSSSRDELKVRRARAPPIACQPCAAGLDRPRLSAVPPLHTPFTGPVMTPCDAGFNVSLSAGRVSGCC